MIITNRSAEAHALRIMLPLSGMIATFTALIGFMAMSSVSSI